MGVVVVVGGREIGMGMGMSGLDIRVEMRVAWWERAVAVVGVLVWEEEEEGLLGRSLLVGRWEWWEWEVGMDSGIGSDIFCS